MYKSFLSLLSLVLLFAFTAMAQEQEQTTLYQSAPADWRPETFPFPLAFAPGIDLKGVEELRFAPGLFDPTKEDYYTYTFLWWLEDNPEFTAERLERDLIAYFQGLYMAVSQKKDYDVSTFKADIEAHDAEGKDGLDAYYTGTVTAADGFVTEKEVTMNFRITQWQCKESGRTAVFFAISPQPYEHAIWKTLRSIKAGGCAN